MTPRSTITRWACALAVCWLLSGPSWADGPPTVFVAEPIAGSSPGLTLVTIGPTAPGGSAVVAWATTGMDTCEGTGPGEWTGPKPLHGAASLGPIDAPTDYTLRCTGPAGTAERLWTLAPPPQPIVTLTADPNIVVAGEPVVLLWESADATDCVGTGPAEWAGAKPPQGAAVVMPPASTVYGLRCAAGVYGHVADSDQVLVAVPPPPPPEPTVTLSAEPPVVDAGEGTRLTWASTDAASCQASSAPSGVWSGVKPINGNELTGPLFTDTVFSLACDSATASVAVTVIAAPPPPPPSKPVVSLSVSPGTIPPDKPANVHWSTTYAASCAARLLVWDVARPGWVDYAGPSTWPSPAKPLDGSEKLGPLPVASTAYLVNLACTNVLGSTAKSVTLWVK